MNNQNGNGNHQEKTFELKRVENPDTLTAIHTREKCCEDRNLSNGGARLFCRLLDFALNPYVNLGQKGQVIVSQLKLATLLNCAPRSVRYRTDELLRLGYVWVSKVPRPNTYPILCYHITAFQPPKQERMEMSADGLWGNCARRLAAGDGAVAARKKANDRNLPVASFLVDRFGKPILRISSVFPLPTATTAPCQGFPVAVDNSNHSPLPTATTAPCQGFPVAVDNSNHSPLPTATTAPCPRNQVADLRESQQEPESPLEPELEPFLKRSTLNASKRASGAKNAENRFLDEVEELFDRWKPGHGKSELQNSGGFWRMGFRSGPGLMRRVLADTSSAIKENRVITSPGQMAVDTWQRWGGEESRRLYDAEQEKLNPVQP